MSIYLKSTLSVLCCSWKWVSYYSFIWSCMKMDLSYDVKTFWPIRCELSSCLDTKCLLLQETVPNYFAPSKLWRSWCAFTQWRDQWLTSCWTFSQPKPYSYRSVYSGSHSFAGHKKQGETRVINEPVRNHTTQKMLSKVTELDSCTKGSKDFRGKIQFFKNPMNHTAPLQQ